MFADLLAKTGLPRQSLRYTLERLEFMGCIEKKKLVGQGNICSYRYVMDLPYVEDEKKDWSEHYQIFNNMVKHGLQNSI